MTDETIAGEATADEQQDRFTRRIAVLLALLAVLAGAINVVETNASTNEARFARETGRRSVQAMAAQVEASTVATLDASLRAEHDALAERPGVRAGAGPAADAAVDASSLDVGPGLAAEESAAAQIEATRLRLERDVLTESRITWNARASQYGTVLTVLAIALFLVGFSLVVSRTVRLPVFTPGLALAGACALWAGWIYAKPIPSTESTAVTDAAAGTVALEHGEPDAALAAFDAAVTADGRYAVARSGRAAARFVAANPDYLSTNAVVDRSPEVLEPAIEDAETAVELDDLDSHLPLTLLGVLEFEAGDYESAAQHLEQALTLDERLPDVWFIKATAELALGDTTDAEAALDRGLALLDAALPTPATRAYAATLLSALERIDGPDVRAGVAEFRDRVVAIETDFVLGPDANEQLTQGPAEITIADGPDLQVQLAADDALGSLAVIAYQRPATTARWSQPPAWVHFVLSDADAAVITFERPTCDPAEIRVDVHRGGDRVSSQVAQLDRC